MKKTILALLICVFATTLMAQNHYTDTIAALEKKLLTVEKYSDEYGHLLEGLGLLYDTHGDYENTMRIMGLIDDFNKHELEKVCTDVDCLVNRAEYYANIGDKAMAEAHYLQAIDLAQSHKDRIEAYDKYAHYKAMMEKEFIAGAENQLAAARAWEDSLGKGEEYAAAVYTAGMYYYLGKNYNSSLQCYRQAEEYYLPLSSKVAWRNLAKVYRAMGNSYSAKKEYAQAVDCHQRVVNYYEQNGLTTDTEYPKAIEKVATAQKFNKDYDASITNYRKALKVYEQLGMSSEYLDAANGLRLCYSYAGRDSEFPEEEVFGSPMIVQNEKEKREKLTATIEDEKSHLEMYRTFLGEMAYAGSLATIGGCYAMLEDYSNSVKYYEQYLSALRDGIREAFRHRNEEERMAAWAPHQTNIQEIYDLLVSLPDGNESLFERLTAVAYDAALLSKGILLNSSVSFRRILQEQGDRELLEMESQITANLKEIDRLRETAATEDDLKRILTLGKENKNIEAKLYKKCPRLASFTDYISYDWQAVQKKLNKDDVAVEFVAVKYNPLDQNNYMVALVLTRDKKRPVALPVCTLLDAKVMESFEPLFEMQGNPVWGILSKLLEGKRRVFFSADGNFHNVGIEYLLYDGKPLSEQYEVYRLSSTKVLCGNQRQPAYNNAALFGNISYNEEGIRKSDIDATLLADLRDNGGTNFADLPFTKEEIDSIEQAFKAHGKEKITLFEDTVAGKNAFVALSGSAVNVLHLATHGGFGGKSNDGEAMQSSFLALAGANKSRSTGTVNAAEVAEMNLRGCDLVVLSACETGLGTAGSDGVFGLQRGFKNAGAGTLLMSLKKVHDKATSRLMIHFYNQLMEGSTPREALVKAQDTLRREGYTESKYWATFILLDSEIR